MLRIVPPCLWFMVKVVLVKCKGFAPCGRVLVAAVQAPYAMKLLSRHETVGSATIVCRTTLSASTAHTLHIIG